MKRGDIKKHLHKLAVRSPIRGSSSPLRFYEVNIVGGLEAAIYGQVGGKEGLKMAASSFKTTKLSWLLFPSAQLASKKSGCIHVKIDAAAFIFDGFSGKHFRISSIWDIFSADQESKGYPGLISRIIFLLPLLHDFHAGGLAAE